MEGLASLEKKAFWGAAAGLLARGGSGLWNAAKVVGRSFGFGAKQSLGKNIAGQAAVGTGLTAATGGMFSKFNKDSIAKGLKKTSAVGLKTLKMPTMPKIPSATNGLGKVNPLKMNVTKSLTTKFPTTVKSATKIIR